MAQSSQNGDKNEKKNQTICIIRYNSYVPVAPSSKTTEQALS